MNEVLKKLEQIGIVPVVVIKEKEKAEQLGKALYESGLTCAEVTFRTEAAADAIRIMKLNYPDMLLGAGTVLTIDQVDLALEAGASFIVSPALNPDIVRYCQKRKVTIVPGIVTPGELEVAWNLGLRVVKLFPAELFGGLAMIQAMTAAYMDMKFMPTGGICAENVRSYLADKHILACGGSWMVKESLIEEGQFNQIRNLCEEAVRIVRETGE